MMKAAKLLRVALGAVIFVLVLELCARLDDHVTFGAPVSGVYSDENLYENDRLGKRGKPNARYRKWQLNEFGYRGPRVEKDRVHIVCFGASETFGLYESEDHEFPRQLERELNARAGRPAFQVVNVAYPGLTLPTATLRVPEIVERIQPRVALIYTTPSFYIDMPPKQSQRVVKVLPPPSFEWRLGERVRNVAKAVLPDAVQTWLRQWQIEHSLGARAAIERLPDGDVKRFGDDLSELLSTLRAHGVEPVVVTHATAFGDDRTPDRDLLISWRKFHPKLKEEGFLDMERRMNQAMRDAAAAQDVAVIDIAREIPPDRKYFADFEHFTDAGAALMAERLAEGLGPALHHSGVALYVNAASAGVNRSHEDVVTR
ncbi:MAG: hypothetical protein LAN37_07585 [Acidobacteriia bacterium]|nr:hypothetical protein [Terriglobia bacterium]